MKFLFKKYFQARISFWNTVSKEWKSIKNDKAIVTTFISLTFLVLIVYTGIYSNEIVKEVPVAIINNDASKTSREYIEMLNSTEGVVTDLSFSNLQQAKQAYFANQVRGIVIIPKNFGKDLRRNRQTTITTFADASNMIFYKRVLEEVTTATGYFNAGIAIKKEMSQGSNFNQAKANYTPVQTVSTSLFNTSSGYATYIIPILTALVIQLVLLMGIGIIDGSRKEDEKLVDSFPRLINKGGTIPILLGKSFVYLVLFAFILPIQLGIVYYLYSLPIRSSLLNVYLFFIPYVMSVVFLGIAISSFFSRREDSIVFIVLTSIPSLMLSGLSFPMEAFTPFYQHLAKILPSTPGINGFVKLTQMKASFSEILNEWHHLWILTLIYFILAAFLLKYKANKEIS